MDSEQVDVVPRRMLDLCRDLLRRSLAIRTQGIASMTDLHGIVKQFVDGLRHEIDELETQLDHKRDELAKAEKILDSIGDAEPDPEEPPERPPEDEDQGEPPKPPRRPQRRRRAPK